MVNEILNNNQVFVVDKQVQYTQIREAVDRELQFFNEKKHSRKARLSRKRCAN